MDTIGNMNKAVPTHRAPELRALEAPPSPELPFLGRRVRGGLRCVYQAIQSITDQSINQCLKSFRNRRLCWRPRHFLMLRRHSAQPVNRALQSQSRASHAWPRGSLSSDSERARTSMMAEVFCRSRRPRRKCLGHLRSSWRLARRKGPARRRPVGRRNAPIRDKLCDTVMHDW